MHVDSRFNLKILFWRGKYYNSDIVKVNDNDDIEENHYDNYYYENNGIYYDSWYKQDNDDYLVEAKMGQELHGKEGRIVRPSKDVELTVYWTRLVARPDCVDSLIITLGSIEPWEFKDPSDKEVEYNQNVDSKTVNLCLSGDKD